MNNITFSSGWILRDDGEWIPGNLVDLETGLPSADWLMQLQHYLGKARKDELAIRSVKMIPRVTAHDRAVTLRVEFDTDRVKELDASLLLSETLGYIRPSPSGWSFYYDSAAAFAHIAERHVSIAKG